jgi:hypothetical protein
MISAILTTAVAGVLLGLTARAQTLPSSQPVPPHEMLLPASTLESISSPQAASAEQAELEALPDAPGWQTVAQTGSHEPSSLQAPDAQIPGTIRGAVTDIDGSEIVGARVTLTHAATGAHETIVTDSSGLFDFAPEQAGAYTLTVAKDGFSPYTSSSIALAPGQDEELPDIALKVAAASTEVDVVYTRYDLAQDQVHAEEKQRIIGIFPNFYVVYTWNAVALTPGQKFKLALRSSTDPGFFLVAGITAGFEQASNDFVGYGEGAEGYAKRFGAVSADGIISSIVGSAILPSILHQDPRYFYKGRGTITARALYAIATVAICKGDNGKWQPNYSNLLGNLSAAGISNLYYPSTNRNGPGVTIDNALIGTAEGAFSSLMQEFVLRKFTPGQKHP